VTNHPGKLYFCVNEKSQKQVLFCAWQNTPGKFFYQKRTCLRCFVMHKNELTFVIFHLQKKDFPGWYVIHKKTCLSDWSYTKKTWSCIFV
jgi:hypothetical protein